MRVGFFTGVARGRKLYHDVKRLSRHSLIRLIVGLIILWSLGSIVILLVERGNHSAITGIGPALWYTIVSMYTVGYGDLVPETTTGKILGGFLFVSGFLLLSITTAIITSIVTTRRLKESRGLERVKLSGHILICGWNQTLDGIIEGIRLQGHGEEKDIVLVNDLSEEMANEVIENHSPQNIKFVKGDFTHEAVLKRAGISNAAAIIIIADEAGGNRSNADERTILATLAVKSITPEVTVCAQLLDESNEPHLKRAEADEVVVSGEYSGFLLASAVLSPGIPQMLREIFSYDSEQKLIRIKIPKSFVGRSFRELSDHLRKEYRALTIGLITETKGFGMGDVLTDDSSSIDQFIKRKFEEAGKDITAREGSRLTTQINPDDDYILGEDELALILAPSSIE